MGLDYGHSWALLCLECGAHHRACFPRLRKMLWDLERDQEEVWPLVGMETSEWVELKMRLAVGRNRALQEKRCWPEVCTSSPWGRHIRWGAGRTLFAEPEWTVLETQQHPFCIHSCSVSNPVLYPLQKSHIHRMFSKMGSSWEILVCSNFSCLGNHQDADSVEMVQDFVISDCSQGSSSLLSGYVGFFP